MEFIAQYFSPAQLVNALTVMAVARIVGEAIIRIGEAIPGKDGFESVGQRIGDVLDRVGRLLTFIGVGNKN